MAVCDNSKCSKHLPMPEGVPWDIPHARVFEWKPGPTRHDNVMMEVYVHRNLYIGKNRTYFHLCDACHNAVEMMK